jgi:2-methylcitrate dehydratase PrpD
LFATHGIGPDDVEHVVVATTGQSYSHCEPLDVRQAPTTPMDAKYSTPYNIAIAAVRGNITLADFSLKRLDDPEVLAFAKKITAVNDPSLGIRPAALPARVEITTYDGRSFSERCDYPRGTWPQRPLAADEIIAKFRDCVTYAAKPMQPDAVDRLVELVLDLENVDDVRSLAGCF